MPYKHPPHIKALLDRLEEAKKVNRERHRERGKQRAPMARQLRQLKAYLATAEATVERWRTWMNYTDDQLEKIRGQEWRDKVARITALRAQILDLEIAIALHDQEQP